MRERVARRGELRARAASGAGPARPAGPRGRMTVAAGILAAGRGERFGGAKVLAEFGGIPLVRRAVDAAMESGLRPVITVVGPRAGPIEAVLPAGVHVVQAFAARRGIAHTLRKLVQALEGWRQVDAVCVGLADQPLIEGAPVA